MSFGRSSVNCINQEIAGGAVRWPSADNPANFTPLNLQKSGPRATLNLERHVDTRVSLSGTEAGRDSGKTRSGEIIPAGNPEFPATIRFGGNFLLSGRSGARSRRARREKGRSCALHAASRNGSCYRTGAREDVEAR